MGGIPLGLGDNQPFPSFPGADPYRNVCAIGNGRIQDFQDPTPMMRLQGKCVSYHDITDFVHGHVVEKERLPLAGSLGQLVFGKLVLKSLPYIKLLYLNGIALTLVY